MINPIGPQGLHDYGSAGNRPPPTNNPQGKIIGDTLYLDASNDLGSITDVQKFLDQCKAQGVTQVDFLLPSFSDIPSFGIYQNAFKVFQTFAQASMSDQIAMNVSIGGAVTTYPATPPSTPSIQDWTTFIQKYHIQTVDFDFEHWDNGFDSEAWKNFFLSFKQAVHLLGTETALTCLGAPSNSIGPPPTFQGGPLTSSFFGGAFDSVRLMLYNGQNYIENQPWIGDWVQAFQKANLPLSGLQIGFSDDCSYQGKTLKGDGEQAFGEAAANAYIQALKALNPPLTPGDLGPTFWWPDEGDEIYANSAPTAFLGYFNAAINATNPPSPIPATWTDIQNNLANLEVQYADQTPPNTAMATCIASIIAIMTTLMDQGAPITSGAYLLYFLESGLCSQSQIIPSGQDLTDLNNAVGNVKANPAFNVPSCASLYTALQFVAPFLTGSRDKTIINTLLPELKTQSLQEIYQDWDTGKDSNKGARSWILPFLTQIGAGPSSMQK